MLGTLADPLVCSSPFPTDSHQDAQDPGHGRVKGTVLNFTRSGEDCDKAEAAAVLEQRGTTECEE